MNNEKKASGSKILEYLNIVAPLLPAPIYWEDVNSKVLGINQQILDGIGGSSELIGKTLYDFYPHAMADYIVKHNNEVMRTEKILSQEESIKDIATGETRWFTAIKAPLRDEDGTIIGIIGTSIDITDRKNAEKQLLIAKEKAEAANLAKSDFISSISHEFRTPMNAMMGMTQLLLMTATDESSREKLNEIMRAGEHLLGLINDILDFSKLESEKFELVTKPFSLKEHFNHTITQLGHLLEHRQDLRLDSYFSPDLPEYVVGDEKCLRQILFNLGGNAIKFTKKGSIKANIFLLNKTEDIATVRIELIDTGMGIAKKKLSLIFDRFTQADSGYNRQYGGTGLGLAITKKLIDRMGGKVGVESKLGKGSCFWCEISFKLASIEQINTVETAKKSLWCGAMLATEALNPPSLALDTSQHSGALNTSCDEILATKHVLMIEDDRLNQLVLNGMLERLGGKAIVFSDAASALVYLNDTTKPVDLILTDIGLPDMSGRELMVKIRSIPRYQSCALFAVTGFSAEAEIERFLNDGADAVLNKPVSFIDLKMLIYRHLAVVLFAEPNVIPAATCLTSLETRLEIFDYAKTLEQLSDNADLLKELLVVLKHELPQYKQCIHECLVNKDSARLAAETHKLQGGVSMLYMYQLEQAASKVNKAIRDNGFNDQVNDLSKLLLVEIDTIFNVLALYA